MRDEVRAANTIDAHPLSVWPGTPETLRTLQGEFNSYVAKDYRRAIEHFSAATALAWSRTRREDAGGNGRVLFVDYPVPVVARVAPTDILVGLPLGCAPSEVAARLLSVLRDR